MDFQRQLDIVNPQRLAALHVTVIGAGGIGSPTVIMLAKMGVVHLTVYDHDTVEAHNPPNQWFGPGDIGRYKVEVLREVVERFSGVTIDARPVRYEAQELSGIVIVAVDNMDVRRMIWDRCKDRVAVRRFIEGRMGAEFFEVFAVNPCDLDQQDRYEAQLYPQSESVELPCTGRAIIYTTSTIGAEIANLVLREALQGTEDARPVHFRIQKCFVSDHYEVWT